MSKSTGATPSPRKKVFGTITSTEVRKVENGFEILARDGNYNTKTFIAKSEAEASKLIKQYTPKSSSR
jgi:membrane peptidoglycan carboxypeptidase